MTLRERATRSRSGLAFWALGASALVVSHDAVFIIQDGPGHALATALRQGAHEYWALVSIGLALLGLAVGVRGMVRLLRLRRWADKLAIDALRADAHRARAPGAGASGTWSSTYLGRSLAIWARLAPLVATGFLLQENIEHMAGHGHLIGLASLGGAEYPLALPVIGAISLLAALVAGAFSAVECELVGRIADALRRLRLRAPRRIARPDPVLRWETVPVLARAGAGRAPPHLLAVSA